MPRVLPNCCKILTIRILALMASGVKRGRVWRLSLFGSNCVYSLMQPQESPVERAVGDKAYTQFTADIQNAIVFNIPVHEMVLTLNGCQDGRRGPCELYRE